MKKMKMNLLEIFGDIGWIILMSPYLLFMFFSEIDLTKSKNIILCNLILLFITYLYTNTFTVIILLISFYGAGISLFDNYKNQKELKELRKYKKGLE